MYRFCRSVGPSRTDSGLERVHDGRLHALVRLGMMSRDNVIISRRFAHAGTTHAVTQCRHYFVFFIILKCNLLIVYTRRLRALNACTTASPTLYIEDVINIHAGNPRG